MARWLATVTYRTEGGSVEVQHYISERDRQIHLTGLRDNWDSIAEIRIVREQNPTRLTIKEQAT